MKKWGHDELQHDLALHLRASGDCMVWENMQMGPAGSPRPDCYTIQKSFTNPRPTTYEIKISTSDFRSDITSGKWQSYLAFSCGVYFAVPEGLIRAVDVPPGCGLIVRHENVWRAAKKPTIQPIPAIKRDVWMKLLIDGVERCHSELRRRQASDWAQDRAIRAKLGDRVADVLRDLDYAEYRVEQAKESAEKISKRADEELGAAREKAAEVRREMLAEVRAALVIPPEVPDQQLLWNAARIIRDRMQAFQIDPAVQGALSSLQLVQRTVNAAVERMTAKSAA